MNDEELDIVTKTEWVYIDRIEELQRELAETRDDRDSRLIAEGSRWSAEINRLRTELAEARDKAGIAKGFHDIAVQERDLERVKNDRLKSELAESREWISDVINYDSTMAKCLPAGYDQKPAAKAAKGGDE